MRYDLLLQSMVPGTPFDSDRVEALLETRGAKVQPGGGRAWLLENGSVEIHPLREGGQWVATEVRVPLMDRTELVREVVPKLAELAKEAGVRFFDPQLGRELSAHDDGMVADQYQRTAHYAGEMMGLASAMPISTTESEGFQPTTKIVFGVIGFFTLLYLLVDWINGQLGG
ncbi:hypothetical protein [Vitiosangium sp. GDMCC 1.1324]|uniref:hypothetical protein n=1 Tax=Vitiosangium sp. (strain GDMCC 1.1324) TaxID=2138576 RepID=UPI000D335B5C|nr:hypothetical protein [Vitiosangium sp. GDMCC 1.1324]PTL77945.1 hypothetical protein DAT35_42365 [Vitiosangium sp. GDMCC 1.1324]